MLIGKLLQSGYSNISYALIEPSLDLKQVERLKKWLSFVSDSSNSSIQISTYFSVPENQNKTFDVVHAIDYDQILEPKAADD